MKKNVYLVLLLTTLLSGSFSVMFGQDSPYKPGDSVKDFDLLNIDGKKVTLKNYADSKGIIVVFTCNHCPFSVAYEDRLISLHNMYAPKGYPVLAINSNDASEYPEDSYEKMILRAKEKAFPFRYVYDETQETARRFGAARTPHIFVLKNTGSDWVVKYIGAIDDNTDNPEEVSKKYVENAVNELLDGKSVSVPFTKAIGCTIKWKK